MENNIVKLELTEYIQLLDELKDYKRKSEDISFNFDSMCKFIQEEIKESNKYHIEQLIKAKNFDLSERLNKKLKNYNYESLFNDFIKVGITFDLIEKLVDTILIDFNLDKENNNG